MRFSFRPVKSEGKDDRVSHWETLRCIPGTVSRLHECEWSRIPTNPFPPSVHTKFYGGALAGDCYTGSFLFAPGKYLTPYSGPFWQPPRLSLYLDRPRRSFYTSSFLCSAHESSETSFFGTDRSAVILISSGAVFRSGVTVFPRWDDAGIRDDRVSRIRDTDSKPLRRRRVKSEQLRESQIAMTEEFFLRAGKRARFLKCCEHFERCAIAR